MCANRTRNRQKGYRVAPCESIGLVSKSRIGIYTSRVYGF